MNQQNGIGKALIILQSFAEGNGELGTIEISQKLGFHKATVSRILLNLNRHDFVYQDPKTKKYSLGPSILLLSNSNLDDISWRFIPL